MRKNKSANENMYEACVAYLGAASPMKHAKGESLAELALRKHTAEETVVRMLRLPCAREDDDALSEFFSVCDGFEEALTVTTKYERPEYFASGMNDLALLVAENDAGGWNIRAILDAAGRHLPENTVDALYESVSGMRGVPVPPEHPEKLHVAVALLTNPPHPTVTVERLGVLARGIVRSPSPAPLGHMVNAVSGVSWKRMRERGIGRLAVSEFLSLPDDGKEAIIELHASLASKNAEDEAAFAPLLRAALFAGCSCPGGGESPAPESVKEVVRCAEDKVPGVAANVLLELLRGEMFASTRGWLECAAELSSEESLGSMRTRTDCLLPLAELLVEDLSTERSPVKTELHERVYGKFANAIFSGIMERTDTSDVRIMELAADYVALLARDARLDEREWSSEPCL